MVTDYFFVYSYFFQWIKKIIKNFWDMEIIGNIRKFFFSRRKRFQRENQYTGTFFYNCEPLMKNRDTTRDHWIRPSLQFLIIFLKIFRYFYKLYIQGVFFLKTQNYFLTSKSWKNHPKKLHTYGSWEFFSLQPRLPKTAQNFISVL
jgi:hypothetical protein